MRCTLILAALFAASWCDLNDDLQNLFKRRCSNWNEMKNRDVVKLLKINVTVAKQQGGSAEKKEEGEQDTAGKKEEEEPQEPAEKKEEDDEANVEKKEDENQQNGEKKEPQGEGGGENEKNVKEVSMKYYCALTQVARLAQQFNVTGLVQYHRPMRPFSLPTQDVVRDLGKILAEYTPVAANVDDHFPFGCDFGVKSYKKRIPQKKNKKNKKKKKQKKKFMTVTEYDAYCVVLTDQFVSGFLGKIYNGDSTKDIKAIVDALNKQE